METLGARVMRNTLDTTGGVGLTRSDGGSSLDVAIAAGLFAILSLGVQFSFSMLAVDSPVRATLWFSIVAAVTPMVLSYWVFGRCWWLIRRDGGRAILMGSGICALAAYDVYTNLWGFVLYSLPFIGFVDYLALGVHVAGMVMVIISLARWSRTPPWFSTVAYGYAGVFAFAVLARRFIPYVTTLSALVGVVFMFALAVSLFAYERDYRHIALQGA
jgi:hypothetical protein